MFTLATAFAFGTAFAQPEVRVPPVKVHGESAYGPVDGYSAERSATGTKTDTAIRDIPQSVQVVPREVIEDQNALTLFDILQNITNVRLQDNENHDETFVIRGFDGDSAPARDGVGFKINGSVGAPDLAGVERVEVLKGPASVLYGAGDSGGLVNLVSKRPLNQPYYSATLSAGSFGFYRGEADLSGPLTTSLRYRFNAAYEHTDSFRDYFINPESLFLAPTLGWSPGASTELTVFAEYQKDDTQLDPGLPVLPGGRIPDVPFNRYYGEAFAVFKVPVYQLRYVLEHGLSEDWSFRSLGALQRADDEQGRVEFTGFEADGRTLNREFRLQSNDEQRYSIQNEIIGKINTGGVRHTLLAGIEYSEDHQSGSDDLFELSSIDVFDPVYAGDFGSFIESFKFDEQLDAFGFYLQDQVRFSPAWVLVAGARLDRYQRTDEFAGGQTIDARIEEEKVSPRVGIVYQPMPELSLFANYAKSFRPQLGLQRSGSPVNAELSEQLEAGVKAQLFEGRASATLAVFNISKENVLATDPVDNRFVLQTGEQRSRGLELDLAGEVSPDWNVIAALALLDAEVTKDTVIAEGTMLTNAARLSGRLWSTYKFRQEPLSNLTVGGGMTYVGERNGDLFQPYDVPGYARFDAFISYRPSPRITFSLNIENLTDKDYINSVDSEAVFPGPPFSVFGKVEVRL